MMNKSVCAVFAHYDKDCVVDDYILFYLKSLRAVCDFIVFVSCNPLAEGERGKLNGLADVIIDEKHSEYDFGSYKRGYFYLKNSGRFEDFDELVFANDSCYGPLYPFEFVFAKMLQSKADFWGITRNKFGIKSVNGKIKFCRRPHIQSYFFSLRKRAFLSKTVEKFFENVQTQNSKNEIVEKYEIGLTEVLEQNGFRSDAYTNFLYEMPNPMLSMWRYMIVFGKLPFIKCSILRLLNKDVTTRFNWEKIINNNFNYSIELINNNLERTLVSEPNLCGGFVGYMRVIWYTIIRFLPNGLRLSLSKFLQKYLKFMTD